MANGAAGETELQWAALHAAVRSILPSATWKALTPEFYLTFWTLSYYDIHVPLDRHAPFAHWDC